MPNYLIKSVLALCREGDEGSPPAEVSKDPWEPFFSSPKLVEEEEEEEEEEGFTDDSISVSSIAERIMFPPPRFRTAANAIGQRLAVINRDTDTMLRAAASIRSRLRPRPHLAMFVFPSLLT